jgi:hypothetical protein
MPFKVAEDTDRAGPTCALTAAQIMCRRRLFLQILSGMLAVAVISAGAVPSAMAFELKTFKYPKIDGKYVDGCYSWPGPCKRGEEANAYCRRHGMCEAVSVHVSNKVGVFQTTRLGDGGTCTASCSVIADIDCVCK